MQTETSERLDIPVDGLITFSGKKSCLANNVCDEPASPVVSTTFLYQLDKNEIFRCCALLSYQLRLKHNVVYAFDKSALSASQLAQFQLFNHITCFSEYIELCKSFILCFRQCNDNITAKFSQESNRRKIANQGRKRHVYGTFVNTADNADHNNPDSHESDDEFRELQSVYEQMENMKKMFDFYFNMFVGEEFDRYIIYEKIYLDTCLSSDIPLTMQLTDFDNIGTLFASLLRLTLVSTDFCNSQFSAFFGTGMMLNMLLYLTIDEIFRHPFENQSKTWQQKRCHWTRLTLLNPEDHAAACLLRDVDSDSYHRAISALPEGEFDSTLGHIYMSKGDTLSTLFLQFNSRLFMRLYEWPERRDVKLHLIDKYVCDNIASYFLKSGRSQQHSWIKFFKRKPQNFSQNASTPVKNNDTAVNNLETHTSSFLSATLLPVHAEKLPPQIFINMSALHSLYDSLACGIQKNNNKRSRLENPQKTVSPFTNNTDNAVVIADNAQVKRNWEALDAFKDSYLTFFINGVALRDNFREWYQKMCVTFILRSGGYRGFCPNNHPRLFSFEPDLSKVYSPDCQTCTDSLYSDFNSDQSSGVFSLAKWAKEVHTMIFPYNFLFKSADFIKNNGVLSDNTLRQAWALKAQELLVSRRFSSDKCLRCHTYLCDLEKRSRLIVEEGQLKNLFISAMENLPFIRDLMDIHENEDDEEQDDDLHRDNTHMDIS